MDKTILGDLDSLPEEEDRLRMSSFVHHLQARDRRKTEIRILPCLLCEIHLVPRLAELLLPCLRMYNALVERCFDDCIESYWRKSLGKKEERCVLHCAQKFLKVSMQVGIKLAELNQAPQRPIQDDPQ